MSIQARLLLAASAVLLVFVGLCGAGLESAFHESALDAEENRLRGLVYALLGVADQDEHGQLELNDGDLPEPRLGQHESGLEAAVLDETGAVLWRSPSQDGALPVVIGPDVGRWKFERLDGDGRFALTFGLRWIGEHKAPHRYAVLVLEDPDAYDAQMAVFHRTLWSWLLAAAAALLLALLMLQRWGLLPLSRLVRELEDVESGARQQIDTAYPTELAPLTGALNTMIRSERGQLQRYRDALGDLAHSLKTPLAVLRGLGADDRLPETSRRQVDEQVRRMQQIADHELSKAAVAGRRALTEPILLPPLVDRIVQAMRKVHRDRNLTFDTSVASNRRLRATESDVLDLLGNLADNASKWAKARVRIEVGFIRHEALITVDDDGPGFPPEAEQLLERGARADTRVPGHGIGLAHVAAIVKAYEGTLTLGQSSLGGARVSVRLPT
jgi:two-component system sensor histidine kinase PhoQ